MLLRVGPATVLAILLSSCAGASSSGASSGEYTACGCGCCEGEPDEARCVASREQLEQVMAEDAEDHDNPSCAERDCQVPILYVVCE